MSMVSQRLRNSAKGQPCTLQIEGVCNHDRETTVLAHLPSRSKGMGMKGHDFFAVFACSACHQALDEGKLLTMTPSYCLQALERTMTWWFLNGDLVVAGKGAEPKREKTSTKNTLRPKTLYR